MITMQKKKAYTYGKHPQIHSCFSANSSLILLPLPGLLTGLVIDSGDGVTHVVNNLHIAELFYLPYAY